MVVSGAEELEQAWVLSIADSLKDHIVSLLDRDEPDILHCLDEGEGATVCLSGLLMQVHIVRVFMVEIVASPELHREAPCDQVFGEASPNEGAISEEA